MLKIKTQFASSFFEEEERCEYLITKKQKQIWAVEIDLLKELMRVCSKYNIRFYATDGTLLGAIRHKGFIPWDDDLDIRMTRNNLDKLIEHQNEFKYPYFLQHALSDQKFFIDFARFRNSETTGVITGMENVEYNNGIYIDICVFDECPTSDIKLWIHLKLCNFTKKLCVLYNKSALKKTSVFKSVIFKILKKTLFKVYSYEFFVKLHYKVMTKYKGKTGYCTALYTDDFKFAKAVLCPISDMDSSVMLPFENVNIPVWLNYEQFLKRVYGDYMKYPPKSSRGAWHDGIINFEPEIPYKEFLRGNLDDTAE